MKCICVIVAGMALTMPISGALAHDDAHQVTKSGRQGGGHASALGIPGDSTRVSRTVEILMSDNMRFSPASIPAKSGETIRFIVKNSGKIKHEMVFGTVKELKAHAALMRKFPEMEHADSNQVSVDAGRTGEMVWQFTRAGKVDFACLQPGHYEAGMAGKITVADTTK